MKSLGLAALVATVSFAFAGCSSCSKEEDAAKAAVPTTCGAGTAAQGNQCVGLTPVK